MTDQQSSTTSPAPVFLSYASEDIETARRLRAMLIDLGIGTWFAVEDISLGDNYAEEIYRALRRSHFVVMLLSRPAVRSHHVRREVNAAIDLGLTVLPLALEPGVLTAPDLPLDWRYWFGIVQVLPLTDVPTAARAVRDRVAPVTRPAHVQGGRRQAGGPDAHRRGEVRAILIQVASERGPFARVLDRCRRLHIDARAADRFAREFQQTGLIRFETPLTRETTLSLAT